MPRRRAAGAEEGQDACCHQGARAPAFPRAGLRARPRSTRSPRPPTSRRARSSGTSRPRKTSCSRTTSTSWRHGAFEAQSADLSPGRRLPRRGGAAFSSLSEETGQAARDGRAHADRPRDPGQGDGRVRPDDRHHRGGRGEAVGPRPGRLRRRGTSPGPSSASSWRRRCHGATGRRRRRARTCSTGSTPRSRTSSAAAWPEPDHALTGLRLTGRSRRRLPGMLRVQLKFSVDARGGARHGR